MFQIKTLLNNIVETAYKGSPKLDEYKRFYVEIQNRELKSKHGDYSRKNHHIRVYNLYRDDSAIIVTTIHELAHHVDTINRKSSCHDDTFYKVYKTLLYTALDMNIFSKDEFLSATRDASDSNKVAKIIYSYKPKDIGYKAGVKKIICYDAFYIKDNLKEHKFSYNKLNKTWEKEVSGDEIDQTLEFLKEIEAKYELTDATNYTFKG